MGYKGVFMRKITVFLLIFPLLLFGEFTGTNGIIDIPRGVFLDPGKLSVNLSVGMGVKDINVEDITYAGFTPTYERFDWDFNIDYRLPINYPLEFALTAYSPTVFALSVAAGIPLPFPMAIGVENITYNSFVSSIDSGYVDEALYGDDRSSEWFSLFIVTSKSFGKLGEYTFGIGRGRFIGSGPKSQYFNTSYLLNMDPDMSMGIFFGGIIPIVEKTFYLTGDFDGRDVNIGMRYTNNNLRIDAALTHVEQMLPNYPASPMFNLSFAYSFDLKPKAKKGKVQILCYDIDTRKNLNGEFVILGEKEKTYNIVNGKLTIELPVDKYQVEVRSKDYISMKKVISVVAGGTSSYKFPLKKMVQKSTFKNNTPQAKLYREALLYYKRGDVVNAIEKMKKCIAIEPDNATYKNFLQDLYKKRNEEIVYHKKAARSFEDKGMKTRAIAEWKAVLKLNPKDYEAKNALKRLTKKKTSTKKKTVKKKSAKPRKTATQWYNEGISYYKKGKYKQAIKCFKEALKLDPKNKKAKRYLKKAENRLKAGG